MSENDRILDKIRKLLKLGNHNDNQFEAEKAIATAMKLAAGIGMTVNEIGEEDEPEKKTVEQTKVTKNKTMEQWEWRLGNALCEAIGGELIHNKIRGLEYVGYPADGELIRFLYEHCRKEIRRLCRLDYNTFLQQGRYMNESKFKRSYYDGAVDKIWEKAQAAFKQETSEAEQQQYALVLLDKKTKVDEFMKNLAVKMIRPRKVSRFGDIMDLGYERAKSINLARPIEKSEEKTCIGM